MTCILHLIFCILQTFFKILTYSMLRLRLVFDPATFDFLPCDFCEKHHVFVPGTSKRRKSRRFSNTVTNILKMKEYTRILFLTLIWVEVSRTTFFQSGKCFLYCMKEFVLICRSSLPWLSIIHSMMCKL